MTMIYDWNVNFVEYVYDDPSDPSGGAEASVFHWDCNAYDDAVSGYPPVRSIGTQSMIGVPPPAPEPPAQTVATLQAMSQPTLEDWLFLSMTPEEKAEIEAGLLDQWNATVEPPGGGFDPNNPPPTPA